MRTYLFIHGAMRGAWIWDQVIPILARAGERALAYDLPGHGARAAERDKVNMTVYVRDVTDFIRTNQLYDLILVGHSMAGIVISRVAEEVPDHIRHLVYVAAVVPRSGEALIDLLPGDRQASIRKWRGRVAEIHAPQELCFTDMGGERKEACLRKLTPQPIEVFFETVDLNTFPSLNIPRTYVLGLEDKSIPPDMARQYAERLGVKPVELAGSHDLMVSRPDDVARMLLSLPA